MSNDTVAPRVAHAILEDASERQKHKSQWYLQGSIASSVRCDAMYEPAAVTAPAYKSTTIAPMENNLAARSRKSQSAELAAIGHWILLANGSAQPSPHFATPNGYAWV